MITLIVVSSVLALIVGLALKFGFDRWNDEYSITWAEYAICAAVVVLVVAPLVNWVGWNLAINNQTTFHENWNGYEVEAVQPVVYQCHESDEEGGSTGGCMYHYDADSYRVWVKSEECHTDPKTKKEVCKDTSHYETRWRQVPYTTTEMTWVIRTTLGDYTVGEHWLPANPEAHRVYPEHDRIHSLPDLPSGVPQLWQDAQARIAAGDPGPVAQRHDYDNYILASRETTLHQYSNAIERYRQMNMLPALSTDPIYNFYYANHAYLMGVNPPGNWQFAVQRFNAALGTDLQGDLYLVIVDANKVSDGQDYIMALTAYWESEKYFGKDAVSKNAIIVAVGTKDGKTVAWARANTGMPVGNVAMLNQMENDLPGTALAPEALLGAPKATRFYPNGDHYKVDIGHTDGAIEKVVWGPNKFERICMKCEGQQGKVGYDYLRRELHPTGWQTFWIYFFTIFGSLFVWAAALYYGVPAGRSVHGRYFGGRY